MAPLACHHSSHFENPCHQLWTLMRVWMKPSSKHFSTLNVFSFFIFIWVNKHQTITNWGVWEKDFFEVVHRNGKGAGPLENFDLSSNLEIQSHWKQASRIPRPLAAAPPDVDIVYKLPLVSAAAGCGSASFSSENWLIQSNSDWRKFIRIGLLRCSGKNRVLLGWRAAI